MKLIINWNKKIIILILFVVFFIGLLVGDTFRNSITVFNERLVPIYKVKRPDKKISITLDGTWGADNTEQLLNIFNENNIKVSFFFAGYWLRKYPELVKKIANEGHEIENHSFTHPHCTKLNQKQISNELSKTSKLIESLIDKKPRFFRPPFGDYNNRVIKTARDEGYQVVQWSIDSLDWQEPGVNNIVNRILENISSGDIILLHNNAPETPKALIKLIPILQNKGYEIVPLSELIYKDNYIIHSHNGLQEKRS